MPPALPEASKQSYVDNLIAVLGLAKVRWECCGSGECVSVLLRKAAAFPLLRTFGLVLLRGGRGEGGSALCCGALTLCWRPAFSFY
jgi:hypothetical protein